MADKKRDKHLTTYDIAEQLGIMALTPTQFREHAILCAKVGRPLVVLGRPGQGKTALIYQIARQLNRKLHVERFNGKDPTDLGFPYVKEDNFGLKRHGFTLPDWFISDRQETDPDYKGGYVYFFDEFLQAVPAMQNRICEILDGSLNGIPIHPLTWNVIAANFAQDKAATYPLPRQIPNRASVVALAPDADDFHRFCSEHDIRFEVPAFVKMFPDCLDSYDPDAMVNCTPRSLVALSPVMDERPSAESELIAYSSIIGKGLGAQFTGFLRVCRDLPKLEDIIAKPKREPVPDEDQTDVMCALAAMLGRAIDSKNITPITEYLVRLPTEFCVFALRDAVRRDPTLKNCRALKDWAISHGDVLT